MDEWEKVITDELLRSLTAVVVSSVAGMPEALLGRLQASAPCLFPDEHTPLPLINRYQSPETLGRDRLANAVAACVHYPGRDVLVLDMGTCLKLDFVNSSGEYLGGSISPGLLMRYRALHAFTARLPLLEPVASTALIGTDTAGSIHAGVLEGYRAEAEGMIAAYTLEKPGLTVLLTGGDAPRFLDRLKSRIFAAPDLTLRGLHAIYLHQLTIS